MSQFLEAYTDINWNINTAFRMMGWFDTARAAIFLVLGAGLMTILVRQNGRRMIRPAIILGAVIGAVIQLTPIAWGLVKGLDDLHAHGWTFLGEWSIFVNVIAVSESAWLITAALAVWVGLQLHRRQVVPRKTVKAFD